VERPSKRLRRLETPALGVDSITSSDGGGGMVVGLSVQVQSIRGKYTCKTRDICT
jgi:hypothetical protein